MKKRENTGKIIGKVFGEARALGVTALAAVVMLSGCGSAGNQAQKGGSGAEQTENTQTSVIIAMPPTSEPEAGFDPAYGWGAGEHMHEPLIQSTLTVTEADLSIGYDLATDVETSEDGMTWTVTIRDDAKFTDGEALTAEDVAFTYNTLKKTSSVNDFSMLKQAEAIDDVTVVFEMERPFAIWSYTMAVTGIVPEHAYGTDYGTHPIGSGRYILKQWDKGQQVILEANPDYYGDAPKMRQVTILFMEEDAALAAAQAGTVDVAHTAASYSDMTVDGYDLFSVQTVDNRGFNLPATEAAEIDGAIGWTKLKSIILPLMMPAFTIGLFLSISNAFKLFDQNLSLTGGGPANSTQMLALNIYNTAFGENRFGLAQSKAVIFMIVVMVISVVQLTITKKKEVEA